MDMVGVRIGAGQRLRIRRDLSRFKAAVRVLVRNNLRQRADKRAVRRIAGIVMLVQHDLFLFADEHRFGAFVLRLPAGQECLPSVALVRMDMRFSFVQTADQFTPRGRIAFFRVHVRLRRCIAVCCVRMLCKLRQGTHKRAVIIARSVVPVHDKQPILRQNRTGKHGLFNCGNLRIAALVVDVRGRHGNGGQDERVGREKDDDGRKHSQDTVPETAARMPFFKFLNIAQKQIVHKTSSVIVK